MADDVEFEREQAERAMGACPRCRMTPKIQYEPGVSFLNCHCKDDPKVKSRDIVIADWNPKRMKDRWNARVLMIARGRLP